MTITNGTAKKELIKKESSPLSANAAQDWLILKEQAQTLLRSGFLPAGIKTAEQCMAIFLMGKELGIGFMESIRSIHVIQGKPTVSPQLMLALANRTGQIEDMQMDTTPQGAVVTIKRKGRKAHTEMFGVKEATDLGLMSKDNYRKQAATMFKWRALAANLRVTFPDAISGLYTPDEMGAEVQVSETEEMVVVANPPSPESNVVPDPKLAEKIRNKPAPTEFNKEPDSEETVTVEIAEVAAKEYKPKKFRYGIKDTAGNWYSTFSETEQGVAEECRIREQKATITYRVHEQDGRLYRNVVSINPDLGETERDRSH